MSTSATIQVDNIYFHQSHDGYAQDVFEGLKPLIKEAQEKDKRNPDFTFIEILQHLMIKVGYDNVFEPISSDYYYKVDEEGNFIVNPD